MREFIFGDKALFNRIKKQIKNQKLIVYDDVRLPMSCSPNRSRLGFGYTSENGYKLYIDNGITYLGCSAAFGSLVSRGEASFDSFEDMVSFFTCLRSFCSPVGFVSAARQRPFRDIGRLAERWDPITMPPAVRQPQRESSYKLDHTVISDDFKIYKFRFSCEQVGPVWRAYIERCPSYGFRSTQESVVHRLNDGRDYVCWKPEPKRLDEITQVSKMWAEATAKYIETGRFE